MICSLCIRTFGTALRLKYNVSLLRTALPRTVVNSNKNLYIYHIFIRFYNC